MNVLRPILLLAWLLFYLVPCDLAEGSTEISTPVDPAGKIPFAFAISGGISLGSYEAGLNWAFTSYLNHHREEISGVGYPQCKSLVPVVEG